MSTAKGITTKPAKQAPPRSTMPSPASRSVRMRRGTTQALKGISTRRGFVPLESLAPLHADARGDVWILTQQCQGYPEGTGFLPDRRLLKEEGFSHKAYTYGLYSLLRGILYTLEQNGAGPVPGGEFARLKADEKSVLECGALLLTGELEPKGDDEATVVKAVAAIERSLQGSIDRAKQRARVNAIRGQQLTDSLQRRNVPAATLSLAGVARQFEKRRENLTTIAQTYRRHARDVSYTIDAQIVPFLRLWGVTQKGADVEKWGFLQDVNPMTLGDNRMALSCVLMQEIKAMFRGVVPIRPFHHHWNDVMRELSAAEDAASHDDTIRFGNARTHLHRCAEWVLLRHAFELDVIARLGILFRRIEGVEKDRRKRTRENRDVPVSLKDIPFHVDQDPEGFTASMTSLSLLVKKAECLSDRGFAVPFREQFLQLCERAGGHMKKNEWRAAKDVLKEATALI